MSDTAAEQIMPVITPVNQAVDPDNPPIGLIRYTKRISNSDLLALPSSPGIEIVPAPGPGKAINLIRSEALFNLPDGNYFNVTPGSQLALTFASKSISFSDAAEVLSAVGPDSANKAVYIICPRENLPVSPQFIGEFHAKLGADPWVITTFNANTGRGEVSNYVGRANLQIGNYLDSNSPGGAEDIIVGICAIYDRLLDDAEITAIENGGNVLHFTDLSLAQRTGLLAWFDNTENSGQRLDLVGGLLLDEINGPLANAAIPGDGNGCALASGKYLQSSNNVMLTPSSGRFTILCFVNVVDPGGFGSGGSTYVFGKGLPGSSAFTPFEWGLLITGTGNALAQLGVSLLSDGSVYDGRCAIDLGAIANNSPTLLAAKCIKQTVASTPGSNLLCPAPFSNSLSEDAPLILQAQGNSGDFLGGGANNYAEFQTWCEVIAAP